MTFSFSVYNYRGVYVTPDIMIYNFIFNISSMRTIELKQALLRNIKEQIGSGKIEIADLLPIVESVYDLGYGQGQIDRNGQILKTFNN